MSVRRPTSTREAIAFAIPKTARVYQLGGLTYGQRLWLDAAVTEFCGEAVTQDELREAMKDGVLAVYDGETQTQALAVVLALDAAIEAYRAAEAQVPPGAVNGNVPEEAKQARTALSDAVIAASRLERALSREYAPLRKLLAFQETRAGTYVELRVQLGVRGWTGLSAPCTRDDDRLTADAMAVIPEVDWVPLNNRIAQLSELTEDAVGESVSPSGVLDTPTSASTA